MQQLIQMVIKTEAIAQLLGGLLDPGMCCRACQQPSEQWVMICCNLVLLCGEPAPLYTNVHCVALTCNKAVINMTHVCRADHVQAHRASRDMLLLRCTAGHDTQHSLQQVLLTQHI